MSEILSTLTIAIPTYNRADSLKYLVDKLSPNLNNNLKLLIIDNNSSDNTEEYTSLWNSYENISCLKNTSNLGGVVNMLRCIEFSSSKYVWLLGDDDDINIGLLPELVNILYNEDAYSFHLIPKSRQNSTIKNYKFVDKKDFGNYFYDITALHLMSSNIYKVDASKKYLDEAYRLVHLQHAFSLFHSKFLEEKKSLKILKLPILKEERITIKRWSKFIAHIDALETTYLLFGKELAEKEFKIRKHEILRVGIISLFNTKNEGFYFNEVIRMIRLVGIEHLYTPLLCIVILSMKKNKFLKYLLIYGIRSIFFLKYKNKYEEYLIDYLRISKNSDIKLHLKKIFDFSEENIFKN